MDARTEKLLYRIAAGRSCYHVAEDIRQQLLTDGYTELSEAERWALASGGKYFVTRGGSSVIAFRVPQCEPTGFMMAAAHSDSPTFKLKEPPHRRDGHYTALHTEKYGGMLMSTWFDRPLSVAGRVFVREDGTLRQHLVDIDRDLLVIPSVAIHMNRNANEGTKLLANVDTLPLFSLDGDSDILALCARQIGTEKDAILGSDLFLYCRGQGTVLGAQEDMILSPKLDDLECVFGCLEGFLAAGESASLPVCCILDNEEVGSETKQGAASTFLRDILRRIVRGMGGDEEQYQMLLSKSLLVSADNAHARHPNHPEFSDGGNCPYLNEGIVIKFNANRRYATDGRSCAIFRSICADAHVPVQTMANRSDLPGGSTLGSIAASLVGVDTVDIGLPQLAMHAAWETAGVKDYGYLIEAMTAFFSTQI